MRISELGPAVGIVLMSGLLATLLAAAPDRAPAQTITAQTITPGHGVYGPTLEDRRTSSDDSLTFKYNFDGSSWKDRLEQGTGVFQQIRPTLTINRHAVGDPVTPTNDFSYEHIIPVIPVNGLNLLGGIGDGKIRIKIALPSK